MEGTLTETGSLQRIHNLCVEKNFSFVSYRTPGSREITTGIQLHDLPARLGSFQSVKSKKGFVFAPFGISNAIPVRLIVPDITFTGCNYEGSLHSYPGNTKGAARESRHGTREAGSKEISRTGYVDKVNNIKQAISNGNLDKVVLSRLSTDPKPEDFNPSQFLNILHQTYPDAFVYLLYIPDTGMWCGATPESLVSVTGNIVTTVSLAGTRKYPGEGVQVTWDEKEIREQDIVTGYIEEVLKKFNITAYRKTDLESMKAGNLVHLKSGFSLSLDALDGRLFEFIEELHPTPSVCGLPKDKALSFLKKTEEHDREYYSGFLGPVDTIKDEMELFVNLRCMKIESHSLKFFIGAGITSGSDPLKEWEETEDKKMTLVNILKRITR
jgi:isochorismate synthase